MNNEQQVEALLFIAGSEGVSVESLAEITGYARPAISTILDDLAERYAKDKRTALMLIQTGGTYKLVTKPELSKVLKKYFDQSNRSGLSAAALEILAIIAYRQPITRIEIDEVRGVHSGTTIQNLVLRNLIKVAGRLNEPGRPKTYATTAEFLDYFGLKNIDELPKLENSVSSDQDQEEDLFLKEFESKMNINDGEN
ncbi:SMC-Scp complex subunit ScpB [Pediococcus stilesii]|uniref:Segregation and condensation protein B n=1 Tax=Pediococcus stilesii TaxID=331679 RepID=A0A5R9BX90_9LACO|nr:SMC-Scp complex subunit ScpB [Pediococcus stilesii]TLQ04903.1 SMC-Scp complex subunit ScpB [Pediococcus stilesii]